MLSRFLRPPPADVDRVVDDLTRHLQPIHVSPQVNVLECGWCCSDVHTAMRSVSLSNHDHQARRPGESNRHELRAPFDIADQRRHLRRMAVGPVRLRQQIVDDVHPSRPEECERLVEVNEFSWPGVGIDEIELAARCTLNELCTVTDVEHHSRIAVEMTLGDRDDARVGVHGIQSR